MGTIYILTNKINNKVYIGQTINPFAERFKYHKYSNFPIGKAIRKHGIENFKTTVFENIKEEHLNRCEKEFIKEYNSISPNGYNLDSGGSKNKHHCKETKKKMSESHLGKKRKVRTEEHRKHLSESRKGKSNGWAGRTHTEETKKKMSEAHKGKIFTIEHIRHLSESKKGKISFMLGRKHTKKSCKKMSESHKGKKRGSFKKKNFPLC